MTANLIPWTIVWAVLTMVVLVLAIYRWTVASHEDDSLHVRDDEASKIAEQGMIAKRLSVIDKWGKSLTVVAFLYGLVLAGLYAYANFVEKSSTSTDLPILR